MPFELAMPFESRHRFIVHLPPGWSLEGRPRPKTIRHEMGLLPSAGRAGPSAGRAGLRVPPPRIDNIRVEPKDFDDYRKFREDVNRAYRVWLTLHASNDLDDAPLLEAVLALRRTIARRRDAGPAVPGAPHERRRAPRPGARSSLPPRDATLWELTIKSAADLDANCGCTSRRRGRARTSV